MARSVHGIIDASRPLVFENEPQPVAALPPAQSESFLNPNNNCGADIYRTRHFDRLSPPWELLARIVGQVKNACS